MNPRDSPSRIFDGRGGLLCNLACVSGEGSYAFLKFYYYHESHSSICLSVERGMGSPNKPALGSRG
jgi:hypothetical protein